MVDPELIQGTLGTRREHILEGMQIYLRAPFTHSFTLSMVLGNAHRKNLTVSNSISGQNQEPWSFEAEMLPIAPLSCFDKLSNRIILYQIQINILVYFKILLLQLPELSLKL